MESDVDSMKPPFHELISVGVTAVSVEANSILEY